MKLMRFAVLTAILAGLVPSLCAQGSNGGTLYASDFAQWSLPQGSGPANGTISWPSASVCQVSSAGFTFTGPKNGRPLRILDNAAPTHSETVIPSNVIVGPGGCSLTATMLYSHLSYSVISGTAGLQEAIDYGTVGSQIAVVILTPPWAIKGGTTSTITSAYGNTNVSILDERTSSFQPYAWNGSAYVATGGILPLGCSGFTVGILGNLTCTGTITGGVVVAGTPIALTSGGTGAATATGALTNLSGIANCGDPSWAGADPGAKINACMASLEPQGGEALIPAGTYTINTQIQVPPNIWLLGQGYDATILAAGSTLEAPCLALPTPAATCQVIRVLGTSGTPTANVHISDLTVENGTPQTNVAPVPGMDGIRADYVNGLLIERVHATSIQGAFGIAFKNSNGVRVLNSVVKNYAYAGVFALEGNNHVWVERNDIGGATCVPPFCAIAGGGDSYGFASGSEAASGGAPFTTNLWVDHNFLHDIPYWECLDTHGGQHVWFEDNTLNNCATGINASGIVGPLQTVVSSGDFHVNRNSVTQGTGAAHCTNCFGLIADGDSAAYPVKDVEMIGNNFTGFGNPNSSIVGVITYMNTRNVKVDGNSFYSWNTAAIMPYVDNWGSEIKGNTAYDMAGTANSGLSSMILIRSPGNWGLTIDDNTLDIKTLVGAPALPAYMINNASQATQVTLGANNKATYVTTALYLDLPTYLATSPVNTALVPQYATVLNAKVGDPIYDTLNRPNWHFGGPLMPQTGYSSLDTTDVISTGTCNLDGTVTSLSGGLGSGTWWYWFPEGMNIVLPNCGIANVGTPASTGATSGGAAGVSSTNFLYVTCTDLSGQSTSGATAKSANVATITANQTIPWTWTAVTGCVNYYAWPATSGTPAYYASVGGVGTSSWTQTAAANTYTAAANYPVGGAFPTTSILNAEVIADDGLKLTVSPAPSVSAATSITYQAATVNNAQDMLDSTIKFSVPNGCTNGCQTASGPAVTPGAGAVINSSYGFMYSSDAPYSAFNAIQTPGSDLWTQQRQSTSSSLMVLSSTTTPGTGLPMCYEAAAGTGAGNAATFWGNGTSMTPVSCLRFFPLTQPTAGQILVGNGSTWVPSTMSGSCTMASGGAITCASGGMTWPTFTGLTKYGGSSNWVTPTYADVTALFGSGSCSGYLKSDGTCSTPGGGGTVTTTGSPASPNIAAFSSSTAITAATSANIQTTLGAATSSVNGYLTSTDWATFNGKQSALTNPVTGPGSGATVGHMAVMGNTSGTSITDGGAIPSVGTWGALNYPAWSSGTPFVKMTAVGTFALDTNTYLTTTAAASTYAPIFTLTTTGSSGAATYTANVLNIPQYAGGGSMTWPSAAGIAVYGGSSAWGTSLTAPAGAVVGTTDTQTLTNKTLDGVTPTTMGYVDPTSSIQTQLNGKQPALSLLKGTYTDGDMCTYATTGTLLNCNTAVPSAYTLPVATSSILGGVKPDGTTISNSSGAISVANPYNPASVAITGGTIDGTVIGGTTPAAATFSASGSSITAPTLSVTATNAGTPFPIVALAPNMSQYSHAELGVGQGTSNYNLGFLDFYYAGSAGSSTTASTVALGLRGAGNLFTCWGTTDCAVGTSTDPGYKFQVSGTANVTGALTVGGNVTSSNHTATGLTTVTVANVAAPTGVATNSGQSVPASTTNEAALTCIDSSGANTTLGTASANVITTGGSSYIVWSYTLPTGCTTGYIWLKNTGSFAYYSVATGTSFQQNAAYTTYTAAASYPVGGAYPTTNTTGIISIGGASQGVTTTTAGQINVPGPLTGYTCTIAAGSTSSNECWAVGGSNSQFQYNGVAFFDLVPSQLWIGPDQDNYYTSGSAGHSWAAVYSQGLYSKWSLVSRGASAVTPTTTLVTTPATATYRVNVALNCTTAVSTATAIYTLKWTDTSSTVQTATGTATCTTLGAASYTYFEEPLNVKTGTVISIAVAVANSPTYDLAASVIEVTSN